MPISWEGHVGPILSVGFTGSMLEKHEVLVVDYVDDLVPVLARMAAKRRSGYRALGYTVE